MDVGKHLIGFLLSLGWALVASVSMSISLGILLKVYDMMTPINEWEEIRKGNIACAIIMAAVILAFGIVVAFTMSVPDTITLINKTAP
ncbi:MAG: DUF350 domain-containing protein [Firmicutes bacterium]|nr:DUF350 domain-containing protein [Bacillota bacterium]